MYLLFLLAGFILAACLMIGFYFIPFLIAHARKHHNRAAIFILNTFLGWTFVGWVVSLTWAMTKVKNDDPVVVIKA